MSSREREGERQREEGRKNPQPTVSISISGFLGIGCYGDASIELEQGMVVQLGSVQLAYQSFSDVGRYSFQIGERDSRGPESSSLNSQSVNSDGPGLQKRHPQ